MGDFNDAFMRNPNAAVQARPKVQNRANVQQLKLIGQSHPTGLTANLLKLFEPRPPLEYKPPPEKRKCPSYTGMAQFVSNFAEPGDPEYAPPVKEAETPAQRRARVHELRLQKGAEKAAEELKNYDPTNDPNVSGDPYKTLFVARLNYETSESKIKREFESYGPIKRVRLVTETMSNKPRGYAFIEYVHTRDMKAAYKQADGRKIDGRRVLVDVERGRTVPNWRPRRLGGGLGTTRVGGGEGGNQREQQPQPVSSSRSEEPRIRDDRERDREKSRERVRERSKDREKSHERPRERPRDRDREERDRHHRDRDRSTRDRDKERERDRGGRDRDRGRDRGRDYERDQERSSRHRDRDHGRDREKDKDYEADDLDRSRSYDREADYEHGGAGSKRKRDRRSEDYDHGEIEDDHGWHEREPGHRRPDLDINQQYDPLDAQGDHDQYADPDRMDYRYDREKDRTRDVDHDYRRSDRDYDH